MKKSTQKGCGCELVKMASARRKNFRTGAEILEEIFADEHSDDSEDDDLLTASSAITTASSASDSSSPVTTDTSGKTVRPYQNNTLLFGQLLCLLITYHLYRNFFVLCT